MERIADIQRHHILRGQVLLGHKTLGLVDGIRDLCEYILYMTIGQFGSQPVLVYMRDIKTVGVLRLQPGISFHKGILIQFEFKWIQVLVCRTIDAAGIRERPLLHRVFIKRDRGTRKYIGIVPAEGRVIRHHYIIHFFETGRVAVRIRILRTQTCLDHDPFL